MQRDGIPSRMYRWIASYLNNFRRIRQPLDDSADEDDVDIEMSDNEDGEDEEDFDEELVDVNQELRLIRQGKKKRSSKKRSETDSRLIVNFDQTLPGTHSYLGNDLEEVRGRTILDENSEIILPILGRVNVVLVPGQVIPLQLYVQSEVAMIRRVASENRTFGLFNISVNQDGDGHNLSDIGCTAEIFSMKDDMDEASGISMVRVKARGRQRLRVINAKFEITGEVTGKVRILPEVSLTHVLDGACLASHRRLFIKPCDDGEMLKTAVDRENQILTSVDCQRKSTVDRLYSSKFTYWPSWVYKMYDIEWLSEQIKLELSSWSSSPLPCDPVALSFWVAHNLPVGNEIRLQLLSFDSVVQRLRFGLTLIRKTGFVLKCNMCDCKIANRQDVFSMSREGPLGAYVNPGGHVHEMFTVLSAKGLRHIGGASTQHSWFPGYAWTIVQCKDCNEHMGWMFTATKKNLFPKKFWGLCRSSVQTLILVTQSEEP